MVENASTLAYLSLLVTESYRTDRYQATLPDGATVVPIILSSDKTQLSVFSGDKTAYPVYLTIGNIPKSIRRKPSQHAQILLAYLPTDSLDGAELSEDAARVARARMFHFVMSIVMEPLKAATRDGLLMTSGDGAIRQCYPIPACYVADYPEQCLVTCVRYGRACPTCKARWEDLELNKPADDWEPRVQRESLRSMKLATKLQSATKTENVLKPLGLNDVPEPFWRDLAHTNIHSAITPDILHQLYQGLVKHLVSWATNLIGATELDARFKRLPPTHSVRHFTSGITNLTMVSGNEHKDICKQLLGCLVGAKGVPVGAIRATRALLDFLYLAQYQSHSESTLTYLQTALDEFHKDKDVFLKTVARNSLSFEVASADLMPC